MFWEGAGVCYFSVDQNVYYIVSTGPENQLAIVSLNFS